MLNILWCRLWWCHGFGPCPLTPPILYMPQHIHPLPVSVYLQSVFRMVAACEGVSDDSSSRQQQSWRWRVLRSQLSWTWTRAWLWPASPSSACCWWPWSSVVQRSSWTPTAPSLPPHGRNSTWMTDALKHTCAHRVNHTITSKVSTQKKGFLKGSVVRQWFSWLHNLFWFQNENIQNKYEILSFNNTTFSEAHVVFWYSEMVVLWQRKNMSDTVCQYILKGFFMVPQNILLGQGQNHLWYYTE